MIGDVIGHASLLEILWMLVVSFATVQSIIKLYYYNRKRLWLNKRKKNGARRRTVLSQIRSEVGRLLLYLGAFATGVYAMTVATSRTNINWFAVGMILLLICFAIDSYLSNVDAEYVTRELERASRKPVGDEHAG